MKIFGIILFAVAVILFSGCAGSQVIQKGSYYSGKYQNLFKDLLGKSDIEINEKIENAFNHLFYGNDEQQRIYYPAGNGMAYILDVNNNDVRTEGMSYGMMIAVQLDKKDEFDRLWKWSKTYMQHKDGTRKDFFAWHCKTNGEKISVGSASDGEEWFITALFLANARWGNGEGIYNYKSEAQRILDAALSKTDSSDDRNVVTNLFNKNEKKVVFVPSGDADDFTDPSYHLPHFYELWAMWADKENKFWQEAADTSRQYFKSAVNPNTGLAPDYSMFNGKPFSPWGGGNENFQYDAWRVAMNIAVDYSWFAKDEWEITYANSLQKFFYSKGINTYGNIFTLDGKISSGDHSLGLVSANAVASLASTYEHKKDFIQQIWDAKTPEGKYRYYDGILYMLGLLQTSGNFRIFEPVKN